MNIMKFRLAFAFFSLLLVGVSIFSLVKYSFKVSIDFTGGAVWEVSLPSQPETEKISTIVNGYQVSVVSIAKKESVYTLKTSNLLQEDRLKIINELTSLDKQFQEVRFTTLGPTLGRELIYKTGVAVTLSSVALLLFIGSRFSDWTFGLSAVIAMLHDSFILLGAFSLLGHLFGAELDSLFVTALLTTLSASVHDTVVTFDRMRELKRKSFGQDWITLANQAVTETIVRSINNSMTVIFMLSSLVILGGETTRWFSAALLIGVFCGTYSSLGVAIPLVLLFKSARK